MGNGLRQDHLAPAMAALAIAAATSVAPGVAVAQDPVAPPVAIADDSAVFSAVVHAVETRSRVLRVDPRPLRADPVVIGGPNDLADVPEEVIRRRTAVLHRLGVSTINYFAFGNCAGLSVMDSDHAACPRALYKHVLVGLARAGGADVLGDIDEHEQGGRVVVRVIEKEIGPGGSAVFVQDYVLRRTTAGWEVVKKVFIGVAE